MMRLEVRIAVVLTLLVLPSRGEAQVGPKTFEGNHFRMETIAGAPYWYWESEVGSQCGRKIQWKYKVQQGDVVNKEAGKCPQGYAFAQVKVFGEPERATPAAAEAPEAKVAATACATKAEFYQTPATPDRDRVRISGQNFKLNVVTADVESQGEDSAGTKSDIKPARQIINSTGTQTEAVVFHRANHAKTYVRIRCGDGVLSTWVLVAK